MTDTALLRLSGVTCVRSGRVLAQGVNLALEPGALLWLTGPNGVGKSSLIRVAAGLLRPFAGVVERRAVMALCDENPALDRALTVRAALAFWARMDGVPGRAVDAALEAMDLSTLADVPVRILSTGQRRRAAMARVVASGAPLWLLDEPANGLDQAAQARLEQVIADHRAGGGVVLLASHQQMAVTDAQILPLEAPL